MAAAIRLNEQHSCSFDDLVGKREKFQRYIESQRLGGFEIDYQLDLRGLFDRQLGGLLAAENFAGIDAAEAECILDVGTVAHQPTGECCLAPWVEHWHCMAGGKRDDLFPMIVQEQIAGYEQRADPLLD